MKINISLTHQERNLFNKELNQHIKLIEDSLLSLEQGYQKEVIEQLFRSFHTIKGNAGMIGFTSLQEISAETEHLLQHFRQNNTNISENIHENLFTVLDYIKHLTPKLSKSSIDINEDENNNILTILKESLSSLSLVSKNSEPSKEKKSSEKKNKTPKENHLMEIYLIPSACMPAVTFFQIIHILQEHNISFSSDPTSEDIQEGISSLLLIIFLSIETNKQTIDKLLKEISIIDDIKYLKIKYNVEKREKDKRSLEIREIKNTKEELSEIQVNINQLDSLINQLGEIIIDRNQIADALISLEEKHPLDSDVIKLSETTHKLWKSSYQLQSQLLTLRSIPLHSILDKYHRLSREIAKKINKKIKLEIAGKELKLDRIILNYLNDILVHLIRNSIDHGIEPPEERTNAGKDPTGLIKIIAEQKNNKVVFKVSDDGKGINQDVILNKILEKQLITKEEATVLSNEQIIEYIFHPGFSTKESVSDISGRGVGMDVVKNTIQKLGGGITVSSKVNIGTTFKITLPLTLAIIKGLIIEVENKNFIIPITYIEEIVEMKTQKIKIINNHPYLVFKDELAPIINLKEIFFNKLSSFSKYTKGITISFSDKKIILIADKLVDEQEIVIKNIDFVGQLYYLIHSATILGTGDIGLILDISALFDEIKRKYNLH